REITVGDEFTDPASIGYIIFESDSDKVIGYTKFYTAGKYRVAIPAVSEINTGDIYITHIASNSVTGWGTGISLLNTTSSTKSLTIEFDNGQTKAVELAANEHEVFLIRGLFEGQYQPGIHSAVVKDASGVIGLELFTNSPGNQMSGILLKDDTTTRIYYPHTASTGGWGTGIVAYNPSETDCDITITPYTGSGYPLTPATDTIGGKQQYIGLVSSLGLPAETAWVMIEAENAITGFELFARTNLLAGYTGVGITGKEGIFVKLEKDGATGIAFVNIEDNPAAVNLNAYNDSGVVVATRTIYLNAHEKTVGTPDSIFMGDISNATYISYSSDRELAAFQLNASSDGMMLDALPSATFETTSAELLTSETIGDQGGTLAAEGFSLTIPPGVFTTPFDLELYKMGSNNDFDTEMVTDTFRVTGIPDEFSTNLLPDLLYTGILSDESFIVVGEEVFISSQSAAGMTYHLFPAMPDLSFLTCSRETLSVLDIALSNHNLFYAYADTETSSRFLDFSGITGWATYTTQSGSGHFAIQYPVKYVTLPQVTALGQYLENAYETYETMGFSYAGRTGWPVDVTVKKLGAQEYGFHCPSMWGHNSATLQFNRDKLNETEQMAITAGHEFFHLVQYLYDPRNVLSRAKSAATHHWLNEACAVWAEEKFSEDPDYVSDIRSGHETSPFNGMHAGAVTGNAGYHGYGMSAFIKFLENQYGDSIIRDIYLKIFDTFHPVEAINIATTYNLVVLWEQFLREYVSGSIYGLGRAMVTSINSGTFRIQSEADADTSFTEDYPDLSAKVFMIRLDDTNISPAKAVKCTIDKDLCDITLFKFRMADALVQFLSHSTTKQLTQKDLRLLTDDGYHLLVMVTNSNFLAPYTNTKQIKLDIVIESIAAAMTLSGVPASVDADGTSTSTITATVTDDVGDPVEGETVTFTAAAGSLSPVSAETDADGVASVVFTAPASQPSGGTSTVTATTTNEVTATCAITINPAPSWPGWPAPQWCPLTGANHVIDYPGGCPDFVTCWYHGNDGLLSEEMPYYGLIPGTGTRSRHGIEKQYYSSGQLYIERPWLDDEMHGIEFQYFESGQIYIERPWLEGKKNGTKKEYWPSGLLKYETPYADDKKNGIEKYYLLTGQLYSETPYVDDKKNGTYKSYYASGQIENEWPYVNDQPHGICKSYYESGQLWGETPYVDGQRNGLHKGYYESGQVWYEISYVDDEKNGTQNEYYESGSIKYETPYVDGEKDGSEKKYYESGQLNVETNWQNDIKHGEEKFYNIDGDMVDCDLYENGILVGSCMP
ncbi:MAG: Ig-like domain-containing protein, partial [Bacteroidales bacterium]|nr:Ig-like domain-containing protein [Bacteroidales bacterium]